MPQRRWYNPNVPQTLAIAQILLYINGVFVLLDAFSANRGTDLVRLLYLASAAAYAFGGYGIANEKKLGWQVGVGAAFSPFVIRFIDIQSAPSFLFSFSDKLQYTFGLSGRGILSVIFDIALIALLLHPMSRNHQKIWFS